nr:acyltransferase family protein [Mycobacterium alsense]
MEGLRAIAVVAVVLFHADMPVVGGGFVGVDVFFVISGFLITGLLWREASVSGTVRLARFYGARARRLLPASATVGLVIMLGSAALLPALQSRPIIGDGIASALYVSNYRFVLQGVEYLATNLPPSPFEHYWSLGVEEQFYLVWPALIIATAWLIRRARRRAGAASASERPYLVVLALVAAVSFALSLVVTRLAPPVAFFSLPTRAWELAIGGLVALSAGQWRRLAPLFAAIAGWGGLVLILLACLRLSRSTPYPGTAALVPVLGAALVIGAGCALSDQGVGRVLAVRPMRAIGRVSYSWYLWHWPVVLVAMSTPAWSKHPLGLGTVAILFSLGLAALTLRFVENPLRFAGPVRRSAARSLGVGGAATAIAVCVGVALLVAVPTPVGHGPAAPALTISATPPPTGSDAGAYDAAMKNAFAQVQALVAASADLKAVPSNLTPPLADATKSALGGSKACLRDLLQIDHPRCATGDTALSTTVALIGDSNAAMWEPAFEEVAAQRHWRLETLTKGYCPWLDLPISIPLFGREYTECERWREQILDRLRAERPRLVVIGMMRRYGSHYGWASGFTSYDPAWIASLTRQVRQLREIGTQVLVVGPIPDPQSVVPICLSVHLDDASACSPPTSKAVNQPGIAAESAATKAGGGQYADLTELFCTPDRCPAIVGNTLVYRDQNHVTIEYGRQLAPVIGALVDRALDGLVLVPGR